MIHPPKQDESQNHACGNPRDSGFWRGALEHLRAGSWQPLYRHHAVHQSAVILHTIPSLRDILDYLDFTVFHALLQLFIAAGLHERVGRVDAFENGEVGIAASVSIKRS